MPRNEDIRKVLVIGSGPIVIGQAAEFDYAGAQACRVLREAGVNVVLVNSNPATIMTDRALADEIYLEPLTAETVRRIIEKERPDSLLAGLGGQTGLTLSMQLYHEGFLQRMGVRLIGTNVDAIDKAEDRELFKEAMQAIGQPALRLTSIAFLLAGYCIVLGSVFQALGNGVYSLVCSVVRQIVVLLPVAYLLSLSGNLNLVWLAFPIAEIASVSVSTFLFRKLYKSKIAGIPE